MKKKFLIFAILFLLPVCSLAQKGWFPLQSFKAINTIQFQDIYFINADTGFLADLYRGCFKTTDGGMTWDSIRVKFSPEYSRIKFFNNNRLGFIFSKSWAYQTADSGKSWRSNPNILDQDVSFPSDSVGYTCGTDFDLDSLTVKFGKTTDAGKTWNYTHILRISTGAPYHYVEAVPQLEFRDDNHGFIKEFAFAPDGSGSGSQTFYTSDGGKTWGPINGTANQLLFLHDSTWLWSGDTYMSKTYNDFSKSKSVGRFPSETCGNPGGAMSKSDSNNISSYSFDERSIYRSTDAGETWYKQLCFGSQTEPVYGAISTPTKLVGYVFGLDSLIYKTIDGGGAPFNAVKNNTDNPKFNIIANPITSSADFRFDALKESSNFQLFDLLGRSLLRQQLSAGLSALHIDMQKYSAGIYFARLGGETVRFVKM